MTAHPVAVRPDVAERPGRPGKAVRANRPAGPGQSVPPELQDGAGRPGQPVRAARSGKRRYRRVLWLAIAVLAAGAAAAAVVMVPGHGQAHVLVTPDKLGAYVKEPHLAKVMDAGTLQREVVTKSAGEAKHVIYAVYEDSTSAAAKSGPQIMLFMGGNLTGASPGGFISSFIGEARGAERISAGSMAGDAACVPRLPGGVTECAWADGDTFGVVASPTLNVSALAAEMRSVRPQVERPAK